MSTSRKVTVFNTVGSKKTVVDTNATTWEELKEDLDKAGIAHSGMRAIVGENQVTLESNKARLPIGLTAGDEVTNNFTLFLSPRKVKSGASSLSLLKQAREILQLLEKRLATNAKRSNSSKSVKREIEELTKKAREIEKSIE